MAAKPENLPYAGDVQLAFGEETITLRCCADAALRLSRLPGALIDWDNEAADTVYRRVRRMHIDTLCEVIRAGVLRQDGSVGVPANADRQLGQKAYDFGLGRLSAVLGDWIIVLSNGGRTLAQAEAVDEAPSQEEDNPLGTKTESA